MGLSTALPKSRGFSTLGHLQIPERSEIQSYTNPTLPNPTMTLRDRRADKKNALTLICLFDLHNIKSTI